MNKRITVLGIAAYWENDKPHGVAVDLNLFEQAGTDAGIEFCRRLDKLVQDVPTGIGAAETTAFFEHLSRQKAAGVTLSESVGLRFMRAVSWMQVHGHLKPDEFNGTLFMCHVEGIGEGETFAMFERNPATFDFAKAIRESPEMVDLTSIARAGHFGDRGVVDAMRAAAEHGRAQRDERRRGS